MTFLRIGSVIATDIYNLAGSIRPITEYERVLDFDLAWQDHFEILRHEERGINCHHDVVMLRRR